MIKKEDLQSLQSGHRARLRKKFLDGQLAEYEMVELLLTYAIPRRDVRTLARQLYAKYGSIHNIISAPPESLMCNEGIKENTVTFLKLIYHIMVLEYRFVLSGQPVFYEHRRFENYCRLLLSGKDNEEFHVFYLDNSYKLILDDLHSTGTINWTAVYVREIVKKALDLNARNIILLHNHPSNTTGFSQDDVQITQELENALNKLSVRLYDHFLFADNTLYSMRALHYLDKKAS